MRQSFEKEKQQIIDEERRKMAHEHRKQMESCKKKSWCVMCLKEADLHCCWNVSYCCTTCQLEHWPEHVDSCKNVDRSAKQEEEKQEVQQHQEEKEELKVGFLSV